MTDLAITPRERAQANSGNLEAFWKSRLEKGDPVARIGYALWVSNTSKLKVAINTGDATFWNNRGFYYWEGMARSTVVNLAAGLEKGGFNGTFAEMRAKIKEVGQTVALFHINFVQNDYREGYGKVRGLLSLKQMADYHRKAFQKFNIPSHFYGGTWLQSVPDEVEFKLYGSLYCHDCDSDEGYIGAAP